MSGSNEEDMSSEKAKTEYNRRLNLPENNVEKIYSMKDWLRIYNLLDVRPFSKAIENCFRSYATHFGVDPIQAYSLPGLAQTAMFKNYDLSAPFCYTIPREEFSDVNNIFRSNVIGGLVNVYRRHASTKEDVRYPFPVSHTDNGRPIKTITFLDFNGMYLSVQKETMPTGPGIVWSRKSENSWAKNVMVNGHSFIAQQWLTFCQHTDADLFNKDGQRTQIQSKFFRGEVKFPKSDKSGEWEVDGFAKTVSLINFQN